LTLRSQVKIRPWPLRIVADLPPYAVRIDHDLAAPSRADALLLVIAVAGVSFSGPLMAATAAPALAIALWRNALGAGVAASVLVARGLRSARVDARAWLTATLAGLALAVHFATWVPSLTMTSVASATALVCTQPVFTGLIALLLGHGMPRAAWIGIGVAVIGAVLITGADLGLSARALAGDVLALAGGAAAAVYVTIGARARSRMSTAAYTAVCYATCAVVLLVACAVGRVRVVGFPADAWLKIALVTVFAQLLGHSLINVVLRSTSPTVVSLVLLFETPGAALVAYLWLHQHLRLSVVPGLVLLFAGLVLVVRGRGHDIPVEAID
jgi:drug/metabolite transporter (DMT)-like permease